LPEAGCAKQTLFVAVAYSPTLGDAYRANSGHSRLFTIAVNECVRKAGGSPNRQVGETAVTMLRMETYAK